MNANPALRRFIQLASISILVAGCGSDEGPTLECTDLAPDQPAISCPEIVDLGCLEEPVELRLDVRAAACDGAKPAVRCSPERGSSIDLGAPMSGQCTALSPSGASASCAFAIRYLAPNAELRCTEAITAECEGATTALSLREPEYIPSCTEREAPTIESDAPIAFELGETTVTYRAGDENCIVPVRIEDTTPPNVDCDELPSELVRTSPAPVTLPIPRAEDRCDSAPEVQITPIPGRGTFDVEVRASDRSGLTSTCARELRVFDAFPVEALRLLGADASEVSLGWTPSTGEDVNAVRVERASSAEGPWEEITTLPANEIQLRDARANTSVFYRVVSLVDEREGGVSNILQVHALRAERYNVPDQNVPGIPFSTSITGIVRMPAAGAGPHPFVLFLHGNHGNCRPARGEDQCETRTAHECTDPRFETAPNEEGYLYLQETLAGAGYASVSISANALNCRPEFIAERTQLILAHLSRWRAWNEGDTSVLDVRGEVDLSRVALIGHSRGGEAVSAAPAALADTPIEGVSLASVFAIGPTDFSNPAPRDVRFAVLLPSCDADVVTLEGLRHYDRGRVQEEREARAQVLFVGANHNFFNTEWRFDDNQGMTRVCRDSALVGAEAQRGTLEYVLLDWLGEERLPAYMRADATSPVLLDMRAGTPTDLRWSYADPNRTRVHAFEDSLVDNDLGGTTSYIDPIAAVECTGRCARNFPHGAAARLAWQNAPSAVRVEFPARDVSKHESLSMRFASRIATINDGIESHDFDIVLVDADGTEAQLPLGAFGRIAHRYPSFAEQEILSTLRVPLAAFTEMEPSLRLEAIEAVGLRMPSEGGNAQGSLWVDDIEFAGSAP